PWIARRMVDDRAVVGRDENLRRGPRDRDPAREVDAGCAFGSAERAEGLHRAGDGGERDEVGAEGGGATVALEGELAGAKAASPERVELFGDVDRERLREARDVGGARAGEDLASHVEAGGFEPVEECLDRRAHLLDPRRRRRANRRDLPRALRLRRGL